MHITALLTHTLREAPPEARNAAHRHLVRGGYLRPLRSGQFATLPLGRLTVSQLEARLREALTVPFGGQEISLPPGLPHEAACTALAENEIHTYRQLPALLYTIHQEPHPPAGLLRARHSRFLTCCALYPNPEGLASHRRGRESAWEALLEDWQLPLLPVLAGEGEAGHAWVYPHPQGDTELRTCPACGYRATLPAARFRKPTPPAEAPAPLEKIHTPETKTISALAAFLGIPESRTAKAVFLAGRTPQRETRLVFAVLRGDMELNPAKLARLTGLSGFRPAEESEIRAIGAEPGFASPVGLPPGEYLTVVDDLIPAAPNLVAGANRPDYHLRNVNYGRDFSADLTGDIVTAPEGAPCPQCGAPLEAGRGVEVARRTPLHNAALFDGADGSQQPLYAETFRLNVSAALACIVEAHHDEYGPIWPPAAAPFDIHMVVLPGKRDEGRTAAIAASLYAELEESGYRVLLDDRPESPGVKFNDADLMGIPWRITVGARSLAKGGVEIKPRHSREREIVHLNYVPNYLRDYLVSPSGEGKV